MTIPVVFVMGPTGTGKTALACALARHYPVEVISVDAAQVYRGLDIGTAKVTAAERRACPHHLIDIRDPDQGYSAVMFREDALRRIDEVRARGALPVLAGGTMFYFNVLLHGLPALPSPDPALRAAIAERAVRQGWPALHAELAAADPQRAAAIAPTDRQRIQRALEIHALTGSRVDRRETRRHVPPWPLIRLALAPGRRADLHRRLAERFRGMLDDGLIDEAAALLEKYPGTPEPMALKLVGYRQIVAYLRGKLGYNDMLEASIADTRRLAKRQLTWLRRQSGITWADCDHPAVTRGVLTYLAASSALQEFDGGS